MCATLSPYLLWLMLSIAGLIVVGDALSSANPGVFHILVHPSGKTSAWLLIITMLASPLVLRLRGWRGPLWLKKNRRYFGAAAFSYAALHNGNSPAAAIVHVAPLALLETYRLWYWYLRPCTKSPAA